MKIFLVFKTHFDIGFTDLSREIIRKYADEMLPEVIETCEQTADLGALKYIWTMPAWPLTVMQQNRAQRPALDRLVQSGQLAWHALPFTSHFDFGSLEDAVQGLKYAVRLSEEYGVPLPISAKMTDVPGHGRALPTVLAGAGVRFLHLGCNEFATPPTVPPLFFWQGVDGARVLTMYGAGGYGSQLTPPEGWNFPVWMALMHTHDNCGPQSAALIRAMVAEARRKCPDAEIVCGTMDDFYHALAACDLSDVPVVTGDLADSWIHGAGTYPAEAALVRQARRDLLSAGAAVFAAGGDRAALADAVDRAYDALALFDEHTWGLDVKTWMDAARVYEKEPFLASLQSEEARRMEISWDEQRQRARTAADEAARALSAATRGGPSVWNPNGAPFTGWAHAAADTPGALRLAGEYRAYAAQVPALTAAPLHALPCAAAPADALQNDRYRLTLDRARGVITELYDKTLGRALLRERDGVGVFSYVYDIYGIEDVTEYLRSYAFRFSDWGVRDNMKDNYPNARHQTFSPTFLGMETQGYTVTLRYRGAACAEYGDAEEIDVEISLPPCGDELFVRLALRGKQRTPMTESGRLALPLAEDTPRYRINKNGDLLDPSRDIVSGANHALYCVEQFLCAEGTEGGLCVLSQDAPLFSIGEPGIYAFRKDYEAHAPILYCNLFNNMWGTNFPQWIGGDLSYRFTLFGYEGACGGAVYSRALTLSQGAYVLPLPACGAGLTLPEGMQVMSLLPDRGGWTLHLRDTALRARTGVLAAPGYTITPIDLRGTPCGAPSKDRIETPVKPFGLLAFRLKSNPTDC